MRPRHVAPLLLLAAALAGCGGQGDEARAPSPPATQASTMPSDTPSDVDPALAGVVDLAVQDLTGRLDVPAEEVAVVSAQAVSWGDTSLGCPEPGMRYAQVVTEGSRIVLEHDGATYDYHAGTDRPDPFLCEDPDAPVGGAQPSPHPTKGLITDPAY